MEIAKNSISLKDTLYHSEKTKVIIGEISNPTKKVIVKMSSHDFPSESDMRMILNEYDLSKDLDHPHIAKILSLIEDQRNLWLVREYAEGEVLNEVLNEPLSTHEMLEIGIQIAETLSYIHEKQIICKDINTNNVIYDRTHKFVKLIDFGISVRQERIYTDAVHINNLEGTLTFISPEQTGRVNRAIDYRTDLYSFGVLLYRMFCGKLPFLFDDPLALVHAHIALPPEVPHFIVPDLPLPISNIILKLLSKNAEDRYQSAQGVALDLKKCLNDLEQTGSILPFEIALEDFSTRFKIPQKLYGREGVRDQLLDAYHRCVTQNQAELIWVQGTSGVGKSSLIHEIYRPITETNGYFTSGKFEEWKRNIPYFAISNSLNLWVDQILYENSDTLSFWKSKIEEALGTNTQLIIDLAPRLELLVGEQNQVEPLPPLEAINRLQIVFHSFIRCIASPENPLCIFIDDLQWADAGSLRLIEGILKEPQQLSLLFIGAYRSNEVDAAHPLMPLLSVLEKHISTQTLVLNNLSKNNVVELLLDTFLSNNREDIDELADLILHKTGGNPFFVTQLLQSLYQSSHILFDYQSKSWIWDLASIKEVEISDNVVELLTNKLSNLPTSVQRVLSIGAVIGRSFDLDTLFEITTLDTRTCNEALQRSIKEELINLKAGQYFFMHDRIQEAAHELLSKNDRVEIHKKIAESLDKRYASSPDSKLLFGMLHQYNEALDAISSTEQKEHIANLNIVGGQLALTSNAFDSAYFYLITAVKILEAFDAQHPKQIECRLFLQEAAYQLGKFEESNSYADWILTNTSSEIVRAKVYNTLILQYTLIGQFDKAIDLGRKGLAELNIEVPDMASMEAAIGAAIGEVMQLLAGRSIPSLLDSQEMEEEADRVAMSLYITLAPTAFVMGNQLMWTYVVLRSTALSMAKGNTPESAIAYSSFGILSGAIFSDYQSGHAYGKLGLDLAEKYQSMRLRCTIMFVYSNFLHPWVQPLHESNRLIQEGIRAGMHTGEIQYASYTAGNSMFYLFQSLRTLPEIMAQFDYALSIVRKAKNFFSEGNLISTVYFYHSISTIDTHSSTEEKLFNPDTLFKKYVENNPLNMYSWHFSLAMNSLVLGEYECAYEEMEKTEAYLAVNQGNINNLGFITIMPLVACLAVWRSNNDALIERAAQKVNQWKPKLEMIASLHPENYGHALTIVNAIQGVQSESVEAMMRFDEAIDLAYEQGFIMETALYNEISAYAYRDQNRKKIFEIYLLEAYQFYKSWGAHKKIELLEMAYPFLLKRIQKGTTSITSTNTLTTTHATLHSPANVSSFIDINTIVRANIVLSGEVNLEKLCEKLIDIAVESAGAQRGILILKRSQGYNVSIEKDIQKNILYKMDHPLKKAFQEELLSEEILNYCLHSRKIVLVDDAQTDVKYKHTSYVTKKSSKSILCLPLIHNSELLGFLYFENALTSGAFTSKRLEILQLLSAQMSISVMNAMLYENLEEKVKDRTFRLTEAYDVIQKKNQDITSSINYAKRIQDALLPSLEIIKTELDSFVLFLPRDIVSGDFYWFTQKGDTFLLAAADCTGHGVPGALMSMICMELLNKVVHDLGVIKPHQILSELHKGVSRGLKQQETGSRDGMDISIVSINKKEKVLSFAGAMNPLYIVNEHTIETIKGDKMPIGGQSVYTERTFTLHSMPLEEDAIYYICSDGFQDQFGGDEGRKYLTKNFRALLQGMYTVPLTDQKEQLQKEFLDWRGNHHPQIDDVLIIGFKG